MSLLVLFLLFSISPVALNINAQLTSTHCQSTSLSFTVSATNNSAPALNAFLSTAFNTSVDYSISLSSFTTPSSAYTNSAGTLRLVAISSSWCQCQGRTVCCTDATGSTVTEGNLTGITSLSTNRIAAGSLVYRFAPTQQDAALNLLDYSSVYPVHGILDTTLTLPTSLPLGSYLYLSYWGINNGTTSGSVSLTLTYTPAICTIVDAFPPSPSSSCVYTSTRVYSVPPPLVFTPATPALTPSDDGYDTVNIGFTFALYGVRYTRVVVSSNGNFQFTTSSTNYVPGALPTGSQSLSPFIGIFYTDLYPTVAGMKTYATLGTAPNRIFIVRYLSVPYFGSYTGNFTGDLIIYETSNTIEMRYYSASVDTDGHSIIIGIDGAGSQVATGSYDYLAVLNAVTLNSAQAFQLGAFSLIFTLAFPLQANPFSCFNPYASAYPSDSTQQQQQTQNAQCQHPGDVILSVSPTSLPAQRSSVNISLPATTSFSRSLACFATNESSAYLLPTYGMSWMNAAFNSTTVQDSFASFLVANVAPLCKWGLTIFHGAYLLNPSNSLPGTLANSALFLTCPTPPYIPPNTPRQLDVSFDGGATFFATTGSVSISSAASSPSSALTPQAAPTQVYSNDGTLNLTWHSSAFPVNVALDLIVFSYVPFTPPNVNPPKYSNRSDATSGSIEIFSSIITFNLYLARNISNTGFLSLSSGEVSTLWPQLASEISTSFLSIRPYDGQTPFSGSRRLLVTYPRGTYSYGPHGEIITPFGTSDPWSFFFLNFFKDPPFPFNTCYGNYCGTQDVCFGYDIGGGETLAAEDGLDRACFIHDSCYNCIDGKDRDNTCVWAGYTANSVPSAQQCDCDLVARAEVPGVCYDAGNIFEVLYCWFFSEKLILLFQTIMTGRSLFNPTAAPPCNPPPYVPFPVLPPPTSNTGGDVHYYTLDHCYYTFQGLGDFTLYKDGNGFNAQIRMQLTAQFPGATLTNGLCFQSAIYHPRVCVYANSTFPVIRVDGLVLFVSTATTASWCLDDICIARTSSSLTLTWVGGYRMIINPTTDSLWSWSFTVPSSSFNSSAGLLGHWDGQSRNDLIIGPNHSNTQYPAPTQPISCVNGAPSASSSQLYGFGYSWYVDYYSSTSLFDFPFPGTSPTASPASSSFTPLFVPTFATPAAQAQVNVACANIVDPILLQNCLFDAGSLSLSNQSMNSPAFFTSLLQTVVSNNLVAQYVNVLSQWTPASSQNVTFNRTSTRQTVTSTLAIGSNSTISTYSASVFFSPPDLNITLSLLSGTQFLYSQVILLYDVQTFSIVTGLWSDSAFVNLTRPSLNLTNLIAASIINLRVRARMQLITDLSVADSLFTSSYSSLSFTVPGCLPSCNNVSEPCGNDGCGRSCGVCASGLFCNTNSYSCQTNAFIITAAVVTTPSSSAVPVSTPISSSSSTGLSNLPPVSVNGDPEFRGFMEQKFQSQSINKSFCFSFSNFILPLILLLTALLIVLFIHLVHGVSGEVYNLISTKSLQLNSRFDFLNGPRHCPIIPSTKKKANFCWSHPGSYLGEIGIKLSGGRSCIIKAGTSDNGFSSVLLNGKEVKAGYSDDIIVYQSSHELNIEAQGFSIQLQNIDGFINLASVEMHELNFARRHENEELKEQEKEEKEEKNAHGLLGQTWKSVRYQGKVKEIEGEGQ